MDLTHKQTAALDILEDNETVELLFGGGAGGAKSVLGCYWLLKSSLKYPGTRWVLGRAVLKTLKETTLNTFWWVCNHQGLKKNVHYSYNENKGLISLSNGSEILLKDLKLYPQDPNFDELGSLEITGAFVDECNQIVQKAWSVLKSRIRYRLDEYGLMPKILGTCNPAKNWVYVRFYAPNKSKTLPANRKFIQSLLTDNPHISKHYKDNLLDMDKGSIERLLHGNWDYDSDPAVLCQWDAIMDCFTNDHVKPTGQKYLSGDLAKPYSTGREIELDLKRIMVTQGIGHSQTVVDADGMGSYLESYLTGIKEFHGGAASISGVHANLKSECGYKLAEFVNQRGMKIICSDEQRERIAEELSVLNEDNLDAEEKKKRIIKKELMKELLGRSPDYLDWLLMHMFFEIKKDNIFGYYV